MQEIIEQINSLLASLPLPPHRKFVSSSHTNVKWLKKNLPCVDHKNTTKILELLKEMH